jgi:HSP20 family protein
VRPVSIEARFASLLALRAMRRAKSLRFDVAAIRIRLAGEPKGDPMAIIPFRTIESLPRRLGTLQQEMNELLSSAFGEVTPSPHEFVPTVDVSEDDQNVLVKAEIPGMSKDDIEIQIDRDLLTLRGEKREEKREENGERTIYREVRHGSFLRQLTLPCEVDADKTEAKLDNGILRLRLPKKEPSRGKRISISA